MFNFLNVETYFKSQRLLVDFLSNLQNVDWSVFSPGEQSSQPCPWFQSPVEEHHVKLIIVKYTKNHETWSKFWDLFKMVKSGQNCEIRSKWNRLIKMFKFCNVVAELSTWQFDLGPISHVFPVKNLKKIRKNENCGKDSLIMTGRDVWHESKGDRCSIHSPLLLRLLSIL